MFQLNASWTVYLRREPIDFRKNINGLAALVEHDLALDPFADALCGRQPESVSIQPE